MMWQEIAKATTPAGGNEIMAHAIETVVLGALLAVGRWMNKRTGQKKDEAAHQSRSTIRASLDTLNATVEAVRSDIGGLREETREAVALLNRRVDGVNYLVTGSPDGDGPNGLRQRSNDHEERLRDVERGNQRPQDVGTFDRRRA